MWVKMYTPACHISNDLEGRGRELWVGRLQGRYACQSPNSRSHALPVCHTQCYLQTWFCNAFSWAVLTSCECWRVKQNVLRFSQLWPLLCTHSMALEIICMVAGIYFWSPSLFMCFVALTSTSPICKPSLATAKPGTYLFIFWEVQPKITKALSYGNTVKVASCFH